jgi:hypothetical protein
MADGVIKIKVAVGKVAVSKVAVSKVAVSKAVVNKAVVSKVAANKVAVKKATVNRASANSADNWERESSSNCLEPARVPTFFRQGVGRTTSQETAPGSANE